MESNCTFEKFVAVPVNFIYLMDGDCFKLISILIQKESYWKNKCKLMDGGWFHKSITELVKELDFKKRKDVCCCIQALVDNGLVRVSAYDGKRQTAKFCICWDKVKELNDISMYDIQEFAIEKIRKLPRNATITYNKCTSEVEDEKTNCLPTINNINKVNNINNKDNMNNIDNTNYNAIAIANAESKDNIDDFNDIEDIIKVQEEEVVQEVQSVQEEELTQEDKEVQSAQEEEEDESIMDFGRPADVEEEEKDFCEKLRVKWTAFIDLNKRLSWIVQPIRTETKCGNQMLISLQSELNSIIKQHEAETATKEVCRKIWQRLTEKVFDFNDCYKPSSDTERRKYTEIIDAVDQIGHDIAYCCYRKHLKKDAADKLWDTKEAKLLKHAYQSTAEQIDDYVILATLSANLNADDADPSIVAFRDITEEDLLERVRKYITTNTKQKTADAA